MRFNSGQEMLETIQKGVDLYSPQLEKYVFVYNIEGSICYYNLTIDDVVDWSEIILDPDENLESHLPWSGHIIDDPSHELYDPMYHQSNLEWCNEVYKYPWLDIREFAKLIEF